MLSNRFVRTVAVVFTIFMLLTGTVSAATPPPHSPQPGMAPVRPPAAVGTAVPAGIPISTGLKTAGLQPAGLVPAAWGDLGQPGLSFRQVGTLGVSEMPYFPNNNYINRPNGLFLDHATNDLYVTEEQGRRVLRYDATGKNTLALGKAGVSYENQYVFDSPVDVALDANKNIWVTDYSRAVEYTPTGEYVREIRGGTEQPDDQAGRFDRAYGIAFDHLNHLFVTDRNRNRVQVFHYDPNSGSAPQFYMNLGGPQDALFLNPGRLAVDSSNTLYVTDNGHGSVQACAYQISDNWTCTTLLDNLGQPEGLDVDSQDVVYIADSNLNKFYQCAAGVCSIYFEGEFAFDLAMDDAKNLYTSSPWECVVKEFDSSKNFKATALGTLHICYETDYTHYLQPRVNVDAQDNLLIVENSGQRVIKVKPDGTPLWSFGVPGFDTDDYGNPSGIQHLSWPNRATAGPDGKVYVADGAARVVVLDKDGKNPVKLGNYEYGSGPGQLHWAAAVAFDSAGYIYVTDPENHRVQIFNSAGVYVNQLGTGSCDVADGFLCGPQGIKIDKAGNIYIADPWSARVLKYDRNLKLQLVLGEPYSGGNFSDNFHFGYAQDVAVDGAGRIYVTDSWQNRVQVFDPQGKFLATIGGNWGGLKGQFRSVDSVAVDSRGRVYISDFRNGTIQVFEPGISGWMQKNISGFNSPVNSDIIGLKVHGDYLYAGTRNNDFGGEVWRTPDGKNWERVAVSGFGNAHNQRVLVTDSINGYLYAGTDNSVDGAQIWRCQLCDSTDWEQVFTGLTGKHIGTVDLVELYNGALYATASADNGGLILRSPTGAPDTWSQVNTDGFGDPSNGALYNLTPLGDYLYAATSQWGAIFNGDSTGVEVWRCHTCDTPADWQQVNVDGFGSPNNLAWNLKPFSGKLYLSVMKLVNGVSTGVQIWRCETCDGSDWLQVNADGFGNPLKIGANLFPYGDQLVAVTQDDWNSSDRTGASVYTTRNGTDWTLLMSGGWGSLVNEAASSGGVFKGNLYLGTANWGTGGQIWQLLDRRTFMPLAGR